MHRLRDLETEMGDGGEREIGSLHFPERKWSEESWMGSGIVMADRVIEAACTCFDAGVGVCFGECTLWRCW